MKREEIIPKIKEILKSFKIFKLTKYMLERKERKLRNSVELKEGLIDFYEEQITIGDFTIDDFRKKILSEQKAIKGLKTDIKKVIKVINLFIE